MSIRNADSAASTRDPFGENSKSSPYGELFTLASPSKFDLVDPGAQLADPKAERFERRNAVPMTARKSVA